MRVSKLATACSGCHSAGGSALSDLTGWSETAIQSRFQSYKDEAGGTTVMHRIARGYTDSDIAAISAYLARDEGHSDVAE